MPGPFSRYLRQFVNSTLNQIALLEAKCLAKYKVYMLSQKSGIPNHVPQLLGICHFIS